MSYEYWSAPAVAACCNDTVLSLGSEHCIVVGTLCGVTKSTKFPENDGTPTTFSAMSSRQRARLVDLPVIDIGELLGIPRPPPGSNVRNVLRQAAQEQQNAESDRRRAEAGEEEKEANQEDNNDKEPNRNNAKDSSGTAHEKTTSAEGSRKISPNNGDIQESNRKRPAHGSRSEEASAKRPANASFTILAASSSVASIPSQPSALNVQPSSVMPNESEACLSRSALSSTASGGHFVGRPPPLLPAMAGPYQAVPTAICFMPPSHLKTNRSRLALVTAGNQLLLSRNRRQHHSVTAGIESNDKQEKRIQEEHNGILQEEERAKRIPTELDCINMAKEEISR
jgi:hypothetical protein